MSSIRNLSGAPSFGSSALENNNGGSSRRRNRSQTADATGGGFSSLTSKHRSAFSQLSSSFAGSGGGGGGTLSSSLSLSGGDHNHGHGGHGGHRMIPGRRSMYAALGGGGGNNSHHHHNMAGEVMGGGRSLLSLQRDQSFSYRPHYNHNVSNSYTLSDNNTNVDPTTTAQLDPSSRNASPSLSPMGSLRRFRSSTWDSSGNHHPNNNIMEKIIFPPVLEKSKSDSDSPSSRASMGSIHSPTTTTTAAAAAIMSGGGTNKLASFEEECEIVQPAPSSDSSDDEHNNNTMEEEKCEITEDNVEEMSSSRASLSMPSVPEIEEVEHDIDSETIVVDNVGNKKSLTDGGGGAAEEVKGIINSTTTTSSVSTTKSSATTSRGGRVTFADDVTDFHDSSAPPEFKRKESRPSFTAKLPALTHWDNNNNSDDSNDDETTSPAASQKGAFNYFHPQNSKPSLLAKLNPFGDLSWSLIGPCIVRTAPCFWCSKKMGMSATDREILLRLNLLCAFFCVIQICSGILLFFVHFKTIDEEEVSIEGDKEKPLISGDLWNLQFLVYCLCLVNVILLVASTIAQRAIREVNLVGSVRYMWVLLWLLPIQIFCTIGLFDYHKVNEVTTKHWWDDESMNLSREIFCTPSNTTNEQCMVPILGGIEYESEEEWCLAKYNSTRCRAIRDDAQEKYNLTSRTFYTSNGIWALVLVVLLWVTLFLLQAIITLPIVQRSKESNIPLWLTFPMIGCYTIGSLLLYSQTSVTSEVQDVYYMSIFYLVSGGAFTLAAFVGYFLKCYTVLNGRQRRFKQGVVIFFIVTIVVTVFSVATIFTTSLLYSFSIVDLPEDSYAEIACALDKQGSCTGCDDKEPPNKCPEWSEEDVQRVLETVMKQSATLAAIFLVYALTTLRYGLVLFRHVSRYQIEYV